MRKVDFDPPDEGKSTGRDLDPDCYLLVGSYLGDLAYRSQGDRDIAQGGGLQTRRPRSRNRLMLNNLDD